MTVFTSPFTGKMEKLGKDPITQKEKIVYQKIEAFLGKRFSSIYVHDLEDDIFSIFLCGEEFGKYGHGACYNQEIFSNYLRFIFEDIEHEDMKVGWFRIRGI